MSNPTTLKGALHWAALGGLAALIALAVGTFIPSIIPAQAAKVNL